MNERLQKLLAYLAAQASQASTWRGVILIVTALTGYNVPPEKAAAIVTIGLFVAGAVGMLLPDKLKSGSDTDTKGTP